MTASMSWIHRVNEIMSRTYTPSAGAEPVVSHKVMAQVHGRGVGAQQLFLAYDRDHLRRRGLGGDSHREEILLG